MDVSRSSFSPHRITRNSYEFTPKWGITLVDLKGKEILIIGGDTRYVEIIRRLTNQKAQLSLIGYKELALENGSVQCTSFEDLEPGRFDAVILPITGITDDGKITSYFSGKSLTLPDKFFQQLKPTCQIFSGVETGFLKKVEEQLTLKITYLFEKDEVAIQNAIPTAEGLILLTIQNTDVTLHGSNVTILGFGRLGQTLVRVYHHLGAKVTVAAREAANRARACEMGVQAISMEDMVSYLPATDICINTIPAMVLNEERLYHLPHHVLLIDAASRPGGIDLDYAHQRGIRTMIAPSLPGLVAPKTAGRILADCITEELKASKVR